ncbi:hypothetical protein EJK55_1630 [Moraxella catarrhalis]|uniref:Uncharacterized protein n=1 Tax=Moraxella catarrhalis TaxID=480 RepID=A0ABY0BK28_MORCA|nr:hypothetical protein EJK52_1816 [Moraxella catarrhalis]EKF82842.1 hypothetical protein MCRH_1837 [Moraxella catarrhalis RH4]AZQ88655.1 hypothetical protein EJK50_1909 [Moraxella catarrhalis]AZQ91779.1 hypothetical protein EJK51_1817 [Moraxella catarrhalis]RUO16411.1 hypothetical protein EJK54_1660 [Moraxella catarrhalis]
MSKSHQSNIQKVRAMLWLFLNLINTEKLGLINPNQISKKFLKT